ncbi:MAG: transketolase [Chitinophagaceae bacterium]|nr:transketolase [Chitinophagaceae bacterium]
MESENTGNENLLENLSFEKFRDTVLKDYGMVCLSREASLLARKEVLTGKAKFGIFGDGKEVAQVAAAKFFKPGDIRSGYYRDQTFVFAAGIASVAQFFSQLYADPDIKNDPFSAGRQMNSHFATANTDENGDWLPLAKMKNSSSDIAPTGGQMPRALGLAFASKLFRENPELRELKDLSDNGNEVCFCSIGDSATSEGAFWETVNAAGVLQVPLAIFVWDDGYGISVPKEYQTVKGSISKVLEGFQKNDNSNGINIYRMKGWDYAGMCEILEPAIQHIRDTHTPALFHVQELTQPQGHSTSGSHERYKSPERLEWEREWDCKRQMRNWILTNALANEEELDKIEAGSKKSVKESRDTAWRELLEPIQQQVSKAVLLIQKAGEKSNKEIAAQLAKELSAIREPVRKNVMEALAAYLNHPDTNKIAADSVHRYYNQLLEENRKLFDSFLYNEGPKSALNVKAVPAVLKDDAQEINGYEVLNKYFDQLFSTNKKVVAFGEDVGQIGDVNQGLSGLQKKYGKERIFDTGIRENTIIGQGYGLAYRGLKPIAEIQYLDYWLYAITTMSDDVATTHYRTFGKQSIPLIIRTRGHRLEGIWHSGSPLGVVINSIRGMYVCVPRNMTQAVGLYNTLLDSNDPGFMIESLNGYRLKEKLISNLLEFRVPLGIPEVIREGNDITIVSYGSILRIVDSACKELEKSGISCEVIDVQTLLPFDRNQMILDSLKKTNRIMFVDEDVPGGTSAFMFNQVMEHQGGYRWLDVAPRTVTGKDHRPGYGTDGDYFSKPNTEDIVRTALEMMAE